MKRISFLIGAQLLALCSLSFCTAARDFGVDVSHFQGESGISQTSWNQIAAGGQTFAFIKATESLSVIDGAMPTNMVRATAAGLRAGVYHFAHPELRPTTSGAAQEADFLLRNAGNLIGPGYLRPVLDLESGSNLGTSALTDWVIAFSNEIVANRGASAAPIIYTFQSYANGSLDSRVANYDVWIRTVNSGADPATADPPGQGFSTATGVFSHWSFWQYSDSGSVGGISPIDMDVCHSEFKSLDSFLISPMNNPVAPTIAAQPQSRTVRVGNIATFSVTPSVNSSTPISYQWFFNGTNIAGATSAIYTRTNAQLINSGSYTVILTNTANSITSAVAVLTVLNPPPPVPPTVLYQENFDEYSTPNIVTSAGTANGFNILFNAASGTTDFTANFGFNYSAVTYPTTIPSAPHSTGGSTKGLSLTVNKDATTAVAAVNLYPAGQTFSGNFALKFDLWINYRNTSSSTEHTLFGVNFSGSVANRIGLSSSDGFMFAMDGDGGVTSASTTIRDFSIYQGGGAGVIPQLMTSANPNFGPAPLLGANFDSADAGFAGLFPPKTLAFTTLSGTPGMGWVSVEVRQVTNSISWYLNDTLVAQFTNTTIYNSGNIMFGYDDAFSSIGPSDNFALFDNIRVETLPDLDENGLPDTWEVQYFGHTGVDPDADADGDGASNLQEYRAGTNPTNAASVFRLLSAVKTNNDVLVSWNCVGGQSYVVQISPPTPNPASAVGITTNFTDISPAIFVSGTGQGTTNFLHTGAALNGYDSYYRVRLGP